MEQKTKNGARKKIVGGPSKYDFEIALSFRKWPRQQITFKIESRNLVGDTENVTISHIGRIDEPKKLPGQEGHWWYFLGDADPEDIDLCQQGSGALRGVYSTQTRTGWVEEISIEHWQTIRLALGCDIPTDELTPSQ